MIEGISYTFTWHTNPDAKDLKCRSLDGQVWQNQDISQPFLIDAVYGPVWDLLADQSYAHPNCKCILDVEIMVDLERVQLG